MRVFCCDSQGKGCETVPPDVSHEELCLKPRV